MMKKYKIYLDDIRIPNDPEWVIVKNYDEFVIKIKEIGLPNIDTISLDHDLGGFEIVESFNNFDTEKTGLDCAKWVIEYYLENRLQISNPTIDGLYVDREQDFIFPQVCVHSANPVGSNNIIGFVNNFLKFMSQKETCIKIDISHRITP